MNSTPSDKAEATADAAGRQVARMRARQRLRILAAIHIGASLGFSVWAAVEGRIPWTFEYVLLVPPIALLLCQSSLLAFWLVFGRAFVVQRLLTAVGGGLLMELLMAYATQDDDFNGLVTTALALAAGVLALIRWRWAELRRLDELDRASNADALQFSIRGLMLLTLVVALLVTGSRWLREVRTGSPDVFMLGFWAVTLVVPNLAALWATLGRRTGFGRWLPVTGIAVTLGTLFGWIIGEPDSYFYFITIALLNSLIQLISLTVVRRSGFRLVGRRSATTSSPFR